MLQSMQDVHEFTKGQVAISREVVTEAHRQLEAIAESQIKEDPLEFVRRESVVADKAQWQITKVNKKTNNTNISMPDEL